MKTQIKVLAAYVTFAATVAQASPGVPHPPLSARDAIATRWFSNRAPIQLSSDGRWLAYTLESQATRHAIPEGRYSMFSRTGVSREGAGREVWVTDVDSRESKRIVELPSSSWSPAWSPDGRYLAFYSDRDGRIKLWIWDRETGRLLAVSDVIPRPLFQFETPLWSPDGTQIVIKGLPEGMSIEDAADLFDSSSDARDRNPDGSASVKVYTSNGKSDSAKTELHSPKEEPKPPSHYLTPYLADLVTISVATGKVQRLARRSYPLFYTLSPDGTKLAYSRFLGLEPEGSQQPLFEIVIISVPDSRPIASVPDVRMTYGRGISWSPNGKMLCYVTSGRAAPGMRPVGDCYVIDTDTGKPRLVTEGAHPNFGANYYSQPLWDPAGSTIYCVGEQDLWSISTAGGIRRVTKGIGRELLDVLAAGQKTSIWSPDAGHSAYVCTRDKKTKKVGFYRIDLTTGLPTRLIEESKAYASPTCFAADVSGDQKLFAYIAQDAAHCADIWVAGPDFESPRQVTQINPQLEKYAFGQSRFIEWRSEDGETLQGALLLPPGYRDGDRCPLIVDVYGGRLSSDYVNRFGMTERGVSNEQALATRGYAVFAPDIPVRIGTPMRDIAKAVMPGVNKMIETGIADPDRLGVTGRSYGGYCVLALIVQTNRFKAAVCRSGMGDLMDMYGTLTEDGSSPWTGWAEEGQGNMGGTPWQQRDRYIENSPVFYLDRVTTPLLLVYGASDPAVRPYYGEQIFVGLRRLGKEVVYARYARGEHTEDTFNPADSIDYFNRTIMWFDQRLKKTGTESESHATR